jgi:hypothetical protein
VVLVLCLFLLCFLEEAELFDARFAGRPDLRPVLR